MAQLSSAQREPSMEEILASIRRIIEDSDMIQVEQAAEVVRADNDVSPGPSTATIVASRTQEAPPVADVIAVDAFRAELRGSTQPRETEAPRPFGNFDGRRAGAGGGGPDRRRAAAEREYRGAVTSSPAAPAMQRPTPEPEGAACDPVGRTGRVESRHTLLAQELSSLTSADDGQWEAATETVSQPDPRRALLRRLRERGRRWSPPCSP